MSDIITKYHQYIYDRYNSLLKSGKEEFDNKDLSKIFEYYTAINLSEQYGQNFYEYNDIDPNFKELNQMSKNDSGVDLCNLVDTIVQCKLRNKSLTWDECSTFFASQIIFNDETNSAEIRWPKLIIARNAECKLSANLSIKHKLFNDVAYKREELLEFCTSLFTNTLFTNTLFTNTLFTNTLFTDLRYTSYPFDLQKADQKTLLEKCIKLRNYQTECIELISSDKNVIIQLPTGCGKNVIITKYISQRSYSKCDGENTKPLKFLILVPRIILMEQIRDEFVDLNLLDNIQLIGDGNTVLDGNKLITICVYNSINKINDFSQFEKIFIDEAHHIIKPEIYYNEEDTNEEDTDGEDTNSEYDEYSDEYLSDDEYNSDENLEDEASDYNEGTKEIKEECNLEIKQENYLSKIRKLKKYNNNVFLSATIDQIDEYEYYSKDIRDMINEKYLCDYNIHIPIFSGSIDMIKSDTNVCKHLIQNYSNIIIYCNTKKEGIEINKIMNELLPLCSEYIDCDTKRNDRNTILEKFKSGEIPFLVNVKILVEGFNAPITKGVCFLHMPSSKTAIIQIIGRALRLHDQKTIANVILPFSNNEDEKTINNFLKILANNDYRIKQSYDNKKLGGYISLNKVEEDYAEEVNGENNCEFRFTMIYDNIGKLINSEEIWVQKLEAVKVYIDEFGRRPSCTDKNIIIKKYGKWIVDQKLNYKKRKNIMNSENIIKIWEKFMCDYRQYFLDNEEIWKLKLNECKQFIDKNKKKPYGHGKDKNIRKLGIFLSNQNKNYKLKIYSMKNENIIKMWEEFSNDIKYKKYIQSYYDSWLDTLNSIKKYINLHKKRPSGVSKDKEIRRLGLFINHQKDQYDKQSSCMKRPEFKIEWENFLIEYNFYMLSPYEKWLNILNEVKQYITIYNKRPSEGNNLKLANWIGKQLDNYKKNKHTMTDGQYRNVWEDFINDEKYKQYFN
jgi:superfamily II DNA or RNA helicase